MKHRIINFLKRYPELFFDILQMPPEIVIYKVDITNELTEFADHSRFGFDVKFMGTDFSFLNIHEEQIQKYFISKLSKAVEIKLNMSFEELEQIRIDQIETSKIKFDISSNWWGHVGKIHSDYLKISFLPIEVLKTNVNIFSDKDLNDLAKNPNIKWTKEIIEELFINSKAWAILSKNEYLPWTEELLDRYFDKWDWKSISGNYRIPWTKEIIEKYFDILDWEIISNDLARKENIKWTNEIIEKLCINSKNWGNISRNKSLPWTEELLDKYFDKWEWAGISGNRGLPWTEELLDKYFDKWNWKAISGNYGIPWTKDLIQKFNKKLDFEELSRRENVPWDIDILEAYKNKWKWEWILTQNNFPWTKVLIEKYYDKINWIGSFLESKDNNISYVIPKIAKSKKIILDIKMLLYFKDKWKLNPIDEYGQKYYGEWNTVSLYYKLNLDLVENYFELLDPDFLIENDSIISFRLIEIIEAKLDRDKFLQFLEKENTLSERRIITNKEKIWQKIIRYYFDEEALLEIIKTES